MTRLTLSRALLTAVCLLAVGCASEPDPVPAPEPEPYAVPLANRADSVAFRLVEAAGGFEAWNALPVLRFDFGFERDGQQQVAARHYWDKHRDRYRVEWPGGQDSTYVAIFSAWPDSAQVYVNGALLDGDAGAAARETARSRTINDTYWLLAPLKVFDDGVTRTFVPDSSTATTDVIKLSFSDVGITPGDQYWLSVDRESGQLRRWTFVLQDNPTPRSFTWTAYHQLTGPAGPVLLSTRKERPGGAILTDQLRALAETDEELFTDSQPRL